ncbi:hypothetical protein [Streptomyces sp. NPDC055243]
MAMSDESKRLRSARAGFWRRLAQQAALSAAGAAGSGMVGLLIFWLRSR